MGEELDFGTQTAEFTKFTEVAVCRTRNKKPGPSREDTTTTSTVTSLDVTIR